MRFRYADGHAERLAPDPVEASSVGLLLVAKAQHGYTGRLARVWDGDVDRPDGMVDRPSVGGNESVTLRPEPAPHGGIIVIGANRRLGPELSFRLPLSHVTIFRH